MQTNSITETKRVKIHLFEQGHDVQENDILIASVDSIEGHRRVTLQKPRFQTVVCECKTVLVETSALELARTIQYHHDSGEHDQKMEERDL